MILSNQLTAFRLLAGPLVFLIYSTDSIYAKLICLVIVILSEVSDGMDGYYARKRNETSDFGKLFDPFADSLSRFTFFLTFMAVGLAQPWMILLIFYRDSLVSFVRIIAATQDVIVSARRTGKIKAVVQATAIITIMVADILSHFISFVPVREIAGVLMFIVVFITTYSAIDYTYGNRHVIRRSF